VNIYPENEGCYGWSMRTQLFAISLWKRALVLDFLRTGREDELRRCLLLKFLGGFSGCNSKLFSPSMW